MEEINNPAAEPQASSPTASTPFAVKAFTIAVVLGALGTLSYYLLEYVGATQELTIAAKECRMAESELAPPSDDSSF